MTHQEKQGYQPETKLWGAAQSKSTKIHEGGHSNNTEEASQSFVEREKKRKNFRESHLGVQDPICLLRITDGQIGVVF